jgi:hypothetical protein
MYNAGVEAINSKVVGVGFSTYVDHAAEAGYMYIAWLLKKVKVVVVFTSR